MSISGDDVKAGRLIAEMRRFSRDVMPAATQAAKEEITSCFADGFNKQQDPDGTPWKPRKDGKAKKLLYTTGELASATITSGYGTVTVRPGRAWSYHQAGANNMHNRHTVPYGPSLWDERIADKAIKAVEEVMPGAD